MNRTRVIKWLRIAWSVVWGLLAVLLVVLWVASYNNFATTDQFAVAGNVELTVEFYHGQTALIFSKSPYPRGTFANWLIDYPAQNGSKLPGIVGFALQSTPKIGDVFM